MDTVQHQLRTASVLPGTPGAAAHSADLPPWRLNVMRVGYLILGVGLALTKWPELVHHEPWELMRGTVVTMLVTMSVLALLGLRYPQRMLPILLFEVGWKLAWLGLVVAPLWANGNLTGATRHQAGAVLWVVVIIAVIPWRQVIRQFVLARGDRWS